MTQRRVRELMRTWYTSGLMGIPGDEDWGAMSSWYVFSAMGFYPVCPGSPTYNIGSPIFDEIEDLARKRTNIHDPCTESVSAQQIHSIRHAQRPRAQQAVVYSRRHRGRRHAGFANGPAPE